MKADPVTHLHQAKPGTTWKIKAIGAAQDDKIRERLMVLGFVPGTRVVVLRRAPLGDPTEYALRGGRISLRRAEASCIEVLAESVEVAL